MTRTAKQVLERVSSWPAEDREELAEIAREIEARRSGVYEPTPEEEAAIRQGLAELDRGEGLSEEEMRAFWNAAVFCENSLQPARCQRPRRYSRIFCRAQSA